jgi:regulatory helix-turn-helix LysR family protein
VKLAHLEAFVAVADDQSLTGRADLARRIRKLEASLGVRLLGHGPQGATLTPAGRAFLPEARATLAAAQAAREAATSAPSAPPAEATLAGLAEAVGLLVARLQGVRLGLSGEVPAPAVAGALSVLAAAFLGGLDLGDGGARLLANIGHDAAHEGTS